MDTYLTSRIAYQTYVDWKYVFTVFGGEAENIVYTLYLEQTSDNTGLLYIHCIWEVGWIHSIYTVLGPLRTVFPN